MPDRKRNGGRRNGKSAQAKLKSSVRADLRAAESSRPQLVMRLELSNGASINTRSVELLEAIEAEGSLTRAAISLGVSYRWAWMHVAGINDGLAQPVVVSGNSGLGGSPACVTEFGRAVIERFKSLEEAASGASSSTISWFGRNRAGR